MAIKIKKTKKSKKRREPNYELVFHYMLGDADGNSDESVMISKDNPYLERFYVLMNKLEPVSGRWGIILEHDIWHTMVEEGQLTQEESDFLYCLCNEIYSEEDEKKLLSEAFFTKEQLEAHKMGLIPINTEDPHLFEFFEGVYIEIGRIFAVFEGLSLYYWDEYGVRHECEVE